METTQDGVKKVPTIPKPNFSPNTQLLTIQNSSMLVIQAPAVYCYLFFYIFKFLCKNMFNVKFCLMFQKYISFQATKTFKTFI